VNEDLNGSERGALLNMAQNGKNDCGVLVKIAINGENVVHPQK